MATVVHGDFEWDDAKAEANMRKHGVSFDEAATAFEDPNHLIVDDGSGDDETYWLVGFSIGGRLLTVVHCERGRRERIISAWRATAEDDRRYREGRGQAGAPPGKRRTKADGRRAHAESGRARLHALQTIGLFVGWGDDGATLPPRGPRGGLWRPLEQYGLMYEGSMAPKVGVYDPCTLAEVARALRDDSPQWLAQCRALVSRRREQIDAEVRVGHEDFVRRARDWQAPRQERAEERYWARTVETRAERARGDQP